MTWLQATLWTSTTTRWNIFRNGLHYHRHTRSSVSGLLHHYLYHHHHYFLLLLPLSIFDSTWTVCHTLLGFDALGHVLCDGADIQHNLHVHANRTDESLADTWTRTTNERSTRNEKKPYRWCDVGCNSHQQSRNVRVKDISENKGKNFTFVTSQWRLPKHVSYWTTYTAFFKVFPERKASSHVTVQTPSARHGEGKASAAPRMRFVVVLLLLVAACDPTDTWHDVTIESYSELSAKRTGTSPNHFPPQKMAPSTTTSPSNVVVSRGSFALVVPPQASHTNNRFC